MLTYTWDKSNNSSANDAITQRLYSKNHLPLFASSIVPLSVDFWFLFFCPDSCAGCSLGCCRSSCSLSHVARQLAVRGGVRRDVMTQQCKQRRARGSSFTPSTRHSCVSTTRHYLAWFFLYCTTLTPTCKSVIPQLYVVVKVGSKTLHFVSTFCTRTYNLCDKDRCFWSQGEAGTGLCSVSTGLKICLPKLKSMYLLQ